jgi:hypothetical protein
MNYKIIILMLLQALFCLSCHEISHPYVDTLYVKGKDREIERAKAIVNLYEHYMNSEKDKEVYEVISESNGRFILNYVPALKLLTLCGDPGSGWSKQLKNVDEVVLQRLIRDNITFENLQEIGTIGSNFDGVLEINKPMYNVKTNGSPSI